MEANASFIFQACLSSYPLSVCPCSDQLSMYIEVKFSHLPFLSREGLQIRIPICVRFQVLPIVSSINTISLAGFQDIAMTNISSAEHYLLLEEAEYKIHQQSVDLALKVQSNEFQI